MQNCLEQYGAHNNHFKNNSGINFKSQRLKSVFIKVLHLAKSKDYVQNSKVSSMIMKHYQEPCHEYKKNTEVFQSSNVI